MFHDENEKITMKFRCIQSKYQTLPDSFDAQQGLHASEQVFVSAQLLVVNECNLEYVI